MRSCAAITIQTKLYRVKSGARSGGQALRMPEWYTFDGLPKDLRKLLHSGTAGDQKDGKPGTARPRTKPGSARKAKDKVAKKVSPKPKVAKKAAQPRPAPRVKAKQRPSSGAATGDLAGPGSQTRLQPVRMQALPDVESPARKRPARGGRHLRRDLRSLSPGCSGAENGGRVDPPPPPASRKRRQPCPAGALAEPADTSGCSGDVRGRSHSSGSEPVSMCRAPPPAREAEGGGGGMIRGSPEAMHADGVRQAEPPCPARSASHSAGASESSDEQSDLGSDAVSPGQENDAGHQRKSSRGKDAMAVKPLLKKPEAAARPAKQLRAT